MTIIPNRRDDRIRIEWVREERRAGDDVGETIEIGDGELAVQR